MEEEYSDLDLDQMADALLESDINEPNLPEKKKQPMVNSLMNIQSYDNTPEYIGDSRFDLAYMDTFDIPDESTGFMGTHGQQLRKEYQKEYSKRPEVIKHLKEYRNEYSKRPEIKEYKKEYQKEYNQRPEVKEYLKEYHKEYNQMPETKERKKEYLQRPEVKEHRKEYRKEYYQRPEIKEHKKEHAKEYNQRPEIKEHIKEYKEAQRIKNQLPINDINYINTYINNLNKRMYKSSLKEKYKEMQALSRKEEKKRQELSRNERRKEFFRNLENDELFKMDI